MVRTVLAILSIALLSACGLKGPLYISEDAGGAHQNPPAAAQQSSESTESTLLADPASR